MSKRVFTRQEGRLTDPEAESDWFRARPVPYFEASEVSPVSFRQPPASVEQLLERLEKDGDASVSLAEHAGDERVLPAVRQLLAQAEEPPYGNGPQILGLARDWEARGLLERKLDEVRDQALARLDHDTQEHDIYAYSAVWLSEALLRIDPWHEDAGWMLGEMFGHADRGVRNHVAMAARNLVEQAGRTGPVKRLKKQVRAGLDDPDPLVFCHVAEIFVRTDWPKILRRAGKLIRDDDWFTRMAAQSLLVQVPPPRGAEGIELVRQWFPKEEEKMCIIEMTANLGVLLGEDRLEEVVASLLGDEAPAVRFDTLLSVLCPMKPERAAGFAGDAVDDEPDEVLAQWLEWYTER